MSTLEPAHTPANGTAVPVYQAYMNPILGVLRRAGRPLVNEELDERVIEVLGLAPEVVAIPHDREKPARSEVSYRLAWACTYLKKAGLLDNPAPGVWALTEEGRSCGNVDARALVAELVRSFRGDGTRTGERGPAGPSEGELESAAARELMARLRETHQRLLAAGGLVSRELLDQQRSRFREEFGPEVLTRLDGEALLVKMHGRSTRDSLVHWLDFKSDAELGPHFGAIGGGTALKFGLYQAADSAAWMTATSRGLEVLSTDAAIARARVQRDQLVRGAELLEVYSREPIRPDFAALQAEMQRVAPDLVDASWAHKYFSLIAPALIGPVHGLEHQRHQLVKALRAPGDGRYRNAGAFLELAAALGVSLYELAATLARRLGAPHAYWRVDTTADGQSEWSRMRDGSFVAVGWAGLGDLSSTQHDQVSRDQMRDRLQRHYPGPAGPIMSAANQVFAFVTRAKERDLVLALDGTRVRGIGRIQGDYFYQAGDGPLPHRRPVEWLSTEEWRLPIIEGLRRSFHPLGKHPINLIQAEARLLRPSRSRMSMRPSRFPEPGALPALEGRLARIQSILQRKRQAILCGPPGTGKTYWADRAVRELSARSWFGTTYDTLSPDRRLLLEREGAVELCTFHPAYGYEDFLEGHRPAPRDRDTPLVLRDGVFKRLCQRAAKHPRRDYFLLIDEINRGDVPRIFGELLTVLEHDKRGRAVTLPVSGDALIVPSNVYLVGTMSTADRSSAPLDAALRRRFGFVELLPDSAALGDTSIAGLPLGAWLDALNQRIVRHAGRDGRHLQVGHSYLMANGAAIQDSPRFAEVLRDDIIPLLEQHCGEDLAALEQILGPALIRRTHRRIDDSLFAPERHAELIEALRSAYPEIATTPRAVAAEIALARELDVHDDEGDEPTDIEPLSSAER
jgi:5-methylcytosine-specific restriction protein B